MGRGKRVLFCLLAPCLEYAGGCSEGGPPGLPYEGEEKIHSSVCCAATSTCFFTRKGYDRFACRGGVGRDGGKAIYRHIEFARCRWAFYLAGIGGFAVLCDFFSKNPCVFQKKVLTLHPHLVCVHKINENVIMSEVMKYILPALVVVLATWLVLWKLLREERLKREFELKKNTQKEITPIRLRGYERLALLLERTTPEAMLRDMDVQNLTAQQISTLLVQRVRQEYDHNLSQQIYVSDAVWDAIIEAREQMVLFLSTTARQFPPETNGLKVAELMLTAYAQNGETPNQKAMHLLKDEARGMFER